MQTPPNPYRPPAAPISREGSGDTVARPRGLAFAAIVIAVAATLTAGIAPIQLKSYRELFAGFGAELPWLSQVVLDGVWIWGLLAASAIGIAVWVGGSRNCTRTTLRRMRLTLIACVIVFVILFVISLVALYLPIFQLGAVV
jgi:hypothetical protein